MKYVLLFSVLQRQTSVV